MEPDMYFLSRVSSGHYYFKCFDIGDPNSEIWSLLSCLSPHPHYSRHMNLYNLPISLCLIWVVIECAAYRIIFQ